VDAGLRAAARDRRVFDDLVELGLARGRLTAAVTSGLVRELAVAALPRRVPGASADRSTDTPTDAPTDTSTDPDKERAVCES
jgi:hypothetical protein